jgi:hypothetical protein
MQGVGNYRKEHTGRALQLLLELLEHLKAYGEHIVLAGGWAPYFLVRDFAARYGEQHIGSLDADLVLDFRRIPESAYETILEILERAGYSPRRDRQGKVVPASFQKAVSLEGGGEFRMQVDFLAGEYGGTPRAHRHQKAQNLLAHKARGADLVFDQHCSQCLSGRLPNGAKVEVQVKIADEVAVFTMKGIAIAQRTKPKDFYDLYMLVKYFNKGPQSIAENVKPQLGNRLVQEALENVRRCFQDIESLGPTSVADFFDPPDPETRAVVQRDAFELFQQLLDDLRSQTS